MRLMFGILGAIAAVLYWEYTTSVDLLADWSAVRLDFLIYAAAGFVVGWVIGFAVSKI